ncbi:MAG: hypothetical protein F4018_13110 [Acidobacteria bacterium]|nr:hypothetical protein [Acidobacteriota bacterium]MYK89190.1 hypothetical protein [Acidobacteriota bacterium]
MTSDEPTEAALPPGHVPTVRVATPNPRDAKRHILVPSGWTRDHMTACVVRLPMDCCETGSAAVDDIECPRCRETPEFARAIAAAREPEQLPRTSTTGAQIGPLPPEASRPKTPARPRKKKPTRNEAADQQPFSPQGSLF